MPSHIHPYCYVTLLGVIAFDGAAFAFTNAWIDPAQFKIQFNLVVLLFCLLVAASMFRFKHWLLEETRCRLSCILQGLLFLWISWIAIRLANHLSMRLTAGIGYVDPLLAEMDRLLFLDWVAYFQAVRSSPALMAVLDKSYTGLTPFSLVAFLVIAGCKDARRSGFFLEAFFYTAVICTFAGMFFPAQGTVFYYLGSDYDFSNLPAAPGMWFIQPLADLRSGAPIELSLHSLPGLVTFPSFHTGACIVLVVSFWRTIFFVPALLCSLAVIAATPIFGGHYLVDLISGTLVAAAVLAVLTRQKRYAGLIVGKAALIPARLAAQRA